MCLDAVSGGRKITFRGPREQPLTYHILLKSTIRALTILFRYHAARVLALGFEIFLTLKFRIGLDWLHKTLFDEVAFDHGGGILNETTESLPRWLIIVSPLNSELDLIFIFNSDYSMADYSLHSIPAPLF